MTEAQGHLVLVLVALLEPFFVHVPMGVPVPIVLVLVLMLDVLVVVLGMGVDVGLTAVLMLVGVRRVVAVLGHGSRSLGRCFDGTHREAGPRSLVR